MSSQLNTNITSLQIIVNALQDGDYITNILPITDSGQIIGYTIGFKKSGIVSIYNGKDGSDGKDGHVPAIAVRQGQDGIWYWTIDGEWLLDGNGEKVQASARDGKDGVDGTEGKDGVDGENGMDGKDGVTPKLKIVDGYWFISYDDGATWLSEPLGPATGAYSGSWLVLLYCIFRHGIKEYERNFNTLFSVKESSKNNRHHL